jgi:hypothetical protein
MLVLLFTVFQNIFSVYDTADHFIQSLPECYTPKKSRVFTKKEFDKFLSDASDQQYLGLKVK